ASRRRAISLSLSNLSRRLRGSSIELSLRTGSPICVARSQPELCLRSEFQADPPDQLDRMASQSPHRLEAFLHAFPRQRQDAAPVAHTTPGAGDGWAIPFTPGRCRAPVVDNALTQVQLGELVGMGQRQIAS